MCCSYYMEESSATKPYIDMAYRNPLREKTVSKLARPFITSGEVKPKDITVAIALTHKGKRSAFPMVWGFTGNEVPHFALLTKNAGEQTRRIHDRMPVILDSVTAASWLQPDQKQETLKEIAASSVTNLIVEEGGPYGIYTDELIVTKEPSQKKAPSMIWKMPYVLNHYFTKLLFTQPLLLSFGKYTQVYPFRVQS